MKNAGKNEVENIDKIISNDDLINSFNLIERDKTILQMRRLYNQSFSTIGKQFDISNEMARVIYNRTINKLSQNIHIIDTLIVKEPKDTKTVLVLKKNKQMPIFNLTTLSKKCRAELKHKNINTLEELTIFSAKDILSFRRFGIKMLEEIETVLAHHSLGLIKD